MGAFGGTPAGAGGPGGETAAPQIGSILPPFARDALSLDDGQRGKVNELQAEIDSKLKEILSDVQEGQLEDLRGGASFGGVAQPGQVMSPFQQARLNLSDEQRRQLDELQKHVDGKLQEILQDEQRTQLSQMGRGRGGFAAGGPDGRRGRGGRGGGGGPRGNSIFRVYRYAADFPGLSGKDLTPGKTLEEISRETETASENRSGN
jgi:hypothetical protein